MGEESSPHLMPYFIRLDALEPRLLLAATIIDGVQPAALDQPRINALLRRPGSDPLSSDATFSIEAFLDTGASGILLSNETADALGIERATFSNQTITFSDVGVAGSDNFHVSEPISIHLA